MPSRTDQVRTALEWAMRAIALAALAWVLWSALTPAGAPVRAVATGAEGLSRQVERWAAEPPERLEITLRSAPGRAETDLLAGLRRSGTSVRWRDEGVPATAVEVVPRGDPLGGATVLVAAPDGERVVIADALGPLDSATAAGPGLALGLPAGAGEAVEVRVGRQAASAVALDSIAARPVLVLGSAGWESRFVVRALEERGWVVHARLTLAPGLEVRLGQLAAVDTARYAAVVALDDSATPRAPAIARYVRAGGGLVLGPDAAATGAFGALAAGTVGREPPGAVLTSMVAGPADLELRPIAGLRPDAVAIERRGDRVTVAGRRVGGGRVVQIGYPETWRWRMSGRGDSPAAHRTWWSDLVASAAYRSSVELAPRGAPADPAPLARLHERLGEPSAGEQTGGGTPGPPRPPPWIAVVILTALAIEWGSRRTRGAR